MKCPSTQSQLVKWDMTLDASTNQAETKMRGQKV